MVRKSYQKSHILMLCTIHESFPCRSLKVNVWGQNNSPESNAVLRKVFGAIIQDLLSTLLQPGTCLADRHPTSLSFCMRWKKRERA